jgi:5-methylcytosine-specific restriction endonuclease McrA
VSHRDHIQELMKRDKMKCQLCGLKIKDYWEASIDHIVSRSQGGSDEIENLQLAHPKCNNKKNTVYEQKFQNSRFMRKPRTGWRK